MRENVNLYSFKNLVQHKWRTGLGAVMSATALFASGWAFAKYQDLPVFEDRLIASIPENEPNRAAIIERVHRDFEMRKTWAWTGSVQLAAMAAAVPLILDFSKPKAPTPRPVPERGPTVEGLIQRGRRENKN